MKVALAAAVVTALAWLAWMFMAAAARVSNGQHERVRQTCRR